MDLFNRTALKDLMKGIPKNLAEALEYDDPEKQLQFHTRTPAGAQKRSAVFHGHGAGTEKSPERVTENSLKNRIFGGNKHVFYRCNYRINRCYSDNGAVIPYRKDRSLVGPDLVRSGPVFVYLGRRRLGTTLWTGLVGRKLVALCFLGFDFCFVDGSGCAAPSPSQPKETAGTPSRRGRERPIRPFGHNPGHFLLDAGSRTGGGIDCALPSIISIQKAVNLSPALRALSIR